MKIYRKSLLTAFIFLLLMFLYAPVFAQTAYKTPSRDVVEIIDAPNPPLVRLNPQKTAMMMVHWDLHPPISFIARPFIKLAGMRIDPEINSLKRHYYFRGIEIKYLADGKTVKIEIPGDVEIGFPRWSYDGKNIAIPFYRKNETGLMIADPLTGKTRIIPGLQVNGAADYSFQWTPDNKALLVKTVLKDRGEKPAEPVVPSGPVIEETIGKFSQMPTYQDLLENAYDDRLFEYFCTSQMVKVSLDTMEIVPIGKPGIYMDTHSSPNGKYLLVTRVKKPYSHRVPFGLFKRSVEVWDYDGNILQTVADLPASEEVPRHGVPTGPRDIRWQPNYDSRLIWAEALDGGDPTRKVSYHDSLWIQDIPSGEKPKMILHVRQRFYGYYWLENRDEAMVLEYDRKLRWHKGIYYNLSDPAATERIIFSLDVNDSYNDPGNPVSRLKENGQVVTLQDGDWIYLLGEGASKKGDRPFLDKMNLKTLKKERMFVSGENCYEQFISFVGDSRNEIITEYQTGNIPPNYYIRSLADGSRTALTHFNDPASSLGVIRKEIIKYKRSDGVPLSGILYMPPGYKKGKRIPLVMWAYPQGYSDPDTAGQVRGSTHTFTRFYRSSPRFFLTRGYALFYAPMPVVGDPDKMNNTFIGQIVLNAKAAIEKLDRIGIINPKKVLIGGHSYGAFMTANLLAHSDLFAAGIARSGAYNRTLTPFGFQAERRTFWEAPEFYLKISPITYANKIKKPLLLIHGMEDNNSGTFPLQSKRLFQAIRGNGGTAKLILLPREGHGYYARESNLHVLAEMLDWADRYLGDGDHGTGNADTKSNAR